MNKVFISHSSKDYYTQDKVSVVKKWSEFVKNLGIECFLAEEDLDKTKKSWTD